jgi:starvation-inducible outer membrane lipoprotein
MKKLALVAVIGAMLSGCVAYPVESGRQYRGQNDQYHRHDRDRDRDGVPNRHDRRPNDGRYY